MRPIVTIILLVIIAAAIAYFAIPSKKTHPQEDAFINATVQLMLLNAHSDTAQSAYIPKRDSVLARFGFTDTSLMRIKSEMNSDPEHLIDVWEKIEKRLQASKDSLGMPADTTS